MYLNWIRSQWNDLFHWFFFCNKANCKWIDAKMPRRFSIRMAVLSWPHFWLTDHDDRSHFRHTPHFDFILDATCLPFECPYYLCCCLPLDKSIAFRQPNVYRLTATIKWPKMEKKQQRYRNKCHKVQRTNIRMRFGFLLYYFFQVNAIVGGDRSINCRR